MLAEKFDHFGVAFALSMPYGSPTLVIFGINVRTLGNKQFSYSLVALLRSQNQGRFAPLDGYNCTLFNC